MQDKSKEVEKSGSSDLIKRVVEAALFVSNEPLSVAKLLGAFDGEADRKLVTAAVEELRRVYDESGHGLQLIEIAGGFQMCTRTELAPYLDRLKDRKKKSAVSAAALETLAIIAYRQPISRQDVEVIRGVNVSGVVHTLLERRLIKIVGRSQAPGRPFLYGTTRQFLEYFGLSSLKDLPDVAELGQPAEPLSSAEGTAELEEGAAPEGVEPSAEADISQPEETTESSQE